MAFALTYRQVLVSGTFVDWLENGVGPGMQIDCTILYANKEGDKGQDKARVTTDENGYYLAGFSIPTDAFVTEAHCEAVGAAWENVVQDFNGVTATDWALVNNVNPDLFADCTITQLGDDCIKMACPDGATCGGTATQQSESQWYITYTLPEDDTITVTWQGNVQKGRSGSDVLGVAIGDGFSGDAGQSTMDTGTCGMETIGGTASAAVLAGPITVSMVFSNTADIGNKLYESNCYYITNVTSVNGLERSTTRGGVLAGGSNSGVLSLAPIVWADPSPVRNSNFPAAFLGLKAKIDFFFQGFHDLGGSYVGDGWPGINGEWSFSGSAVFVDRAPYSGGVAGRLNIVVNVTVQYFDPSNDFADLGKKTHTFRTTTDNAGNWNLDARVGDNTNKRRVVAVDAQVSMQQDFYPRGTTSTVASVTTGNGLPAGGQGPRIPKFKTAVGQIVINPGGP